jgi:branched-chain amino acid transport system substrate-binding protein
VIEALARHAVTELGLRRIILLTSGDHDGRTGTLEILPALGRLRSPPVLHLSFDASQTDFSQHLDRVSSTPADAILLWGPPEPCCRLLVALRGRGVTLPFFGPPTVFLPSFIEKAGAGANGLTTCRLTWGGDEARWQGFEEAFETRYGEKPGADAALAYDAATIIVEAIRESGLNRARIRDAVAEMSGFSGVCGKVTWDNGGGNIVCPVLVQAKNGEVCRVEEGRSTCRSNVRGFNCRPPLPARFIRR